MDVQPVVAYLMAAVVLALAGYFAAQQLHTLRRLPAQSDLADADISYFRHQAYLRLSCCVLMLLLAGLVAGAYVFGLEERATDLGRALQAQRERGEDPVLDAEQKQFRRLYGGYWITVLVLLMLSLFLAAWDIWAIRRFGRRHMDQIDADRRAMVQEQVAILRSQRNGHQ